MKISEGGREGGKGVVLLKEWITHSLSRGLVIKPRWQMAHFLVLVVELHVHVTPFLSISVCWFWFRLSQTRKRSPEEMGLLV